MDSKQNEVDNSTSKNQSDKARSLSIEPEQEVQ